MTALRGIQGCSLYGSNKPQQIIGENEETTEDCLDFDLLLNQLIMNQLVNLDKAERLDLAGFDGVTSEIEPIKTLCCKTDERLAKYAKDIENNEIFKQQGSSKEIIPQGNPDSKEENPLKMDDKNAFMMRAPIDSILKSLVPNELHVQEETLPIMNPSEPKEVSSVIDTLGQEDTLETMNLEKVEPEEHKLHRHAEKMSFKDSGESENNTEADDGKIDRHMDKPISMKPNEFEYPKMILPNSSSSSIRNLDEIYMVLYKGIGQGKDKEKTTLTIKLHPEELGHLKIQLEVKEGIIKGNIMVDNETAKNALQSHLPDMKEQLRNQGLSIENLDVSLEQQFSKNFSESAEERNRYFTKHFEHSRKEISHVLYEMQHVGSSQRLNILA